MAEPKKSVSTQLKEFLGKNAGEYASGELQRMEWKNRDGTTATPRTIVRRLQELAQNGEIYVKEINGHAHYSAEPIIVVKKIKGYVLLDGKVVEV